MSVSLVEASGSSQTQKWGSESLENGLYGYLLSAGPRIKDDWYHMHCVVSLCRVIVSCHTYTCVVEFMFRCILCYIC